MKTVKHINDNGIEVTIHFDDLQFQELDKIDHSIYYECRGYDANGKEYTGVAEFTCDEFEGITDIEEL